MRNEVQHPLPPSRSLSPPPGAPPHLVVTPLPIHLRRLSHASSAAGLRKFGWQLTSNTTKAEAGTEAVPTSRWHKGRSSQRRRLSEHLESPAIAALRAQLYAAYEPYNEALFELLHR
jgi:hypothetical protein